MQNIIVSVIFIIVIIGIVFFVGQFLINQWVNIQKSFQSQKEEPQEDISKEEIKTTKSIIKSADSTPVSQIKPEPAIPIETLITSGPREGEIIEDTNKITFEFKAESDTKERISFETKIEGLDEDWISTSSQKRTIEFSSGPKEYTFSVRAKVKNSVDSTPASRTFKINTSPYFGKIEIYSKKSQTSSSPSQITLSSRLDKEEKINITNWRVKGNKGEIIIPQAINKYQTFGVPGNIFIKQYDKVYLLSGLSPLGSNTNFRLNKCFGYYTNYQTFYPSISKDCPKPKLEEIPHLNQYCQEFILDLSRCEIPNYSDNFRVATNSECVSYLLNNFNYSGCLKYHQNDEDFLKNDWYVYINTNIVSQLHDILYLRDKNGLLVDKYLY